MNAHRHRRNRRARGFTLIEMIAVVLIIGLIVGIGVPSVMGYIDDAKVKTARGQTKLFSNALEMFYMHNDRFPTEQEGLDALINKPADARHWPRGGYVKMSRIPADPWGEEYVYMVRTSDEGDQAQVISYGKDRKPGGSGLNADIVNGEVSAEGEGNM